MITYKYKVYGGLQMILYHGSTEIVDKPEIRESKTYLDFGMGFYTTTSFVQAQRWAQIKMRRQNSDKCFMNSILKKLRKVFV